MLAARPAANPPGPKDKQGRKHEGGAEQLEAPGMCRCGSLARRLHNPSRTATGTCWGLRRGSAPRRGTGCAGVACRCRAPPVTPCHTRYRLVGLHAWRRLPRLAAFVLLTYACTPTRAWRAAGRGNAAPCHMGPSAGSSWGLPVPSHHAPAGYFVIVSLISSGFVTGVLCASVSP